MSSLLVSPHGHGRPRIFVRGPRHLEDLLEAELLALGATATHRRAGGVQCEADVALACGICFRSRLATRVLWPLAAFPAADAEALYAGTAALDWAGLIRPGATLAVGFDGVSRTLRNSRFSALRVKDAVVDRVRDVRGERPDVDVRDPDFRLQAVLHRDRVTLYLDLAGHALHRRGWRGAGGEAPLKENLAAAVLLRGGWGTGREDWLVDPLCGAGTLLVEGALLAAGVAPGVLQERFGFQAWTACDPDMLARLRDATPPPAGPVRLFGRDRDPAQVDRAREHLARAGAGTRFEAEIDLAVGELDVLDALPQPVGLVVANPPYGERLPRADALATLGRVLRRRAAGAPLSLLVGRPRSPASAAADPLAALDLPGLVRHACRNGPLEAWILTGAVAEEAPEAVDAAAVAHAAMFANRLRKNAQRLGRLARRLGTDAWRLYDRDLPEYGFVVDRYGEALVVQEVAPPASVDPAMAERRRRAALAVLPEAAQVRETAVYVRTRRRQRPETQYGVHERRADRRVVDEAPARFLVNLSDYLDTGLYLDSRGVRRRVREHFERTGGGRFLNLYAYTATATVQAALGGATESVSVDLSRTYLDWAGENLALNDLDVRRHRRVRADALDWLSEAAPTEVLFDLVLLDPPTFSNSARTQEDLDLQRDHERLLDAAIATLAPGGRLLFVVHARRFRLSWSPPPAWRVEEITHVTLDADCGRGHPAHRCWEVRPAS